MDELLGKMKSAFGGFGKKPASVLGLDISSSAIKAVQLTKKNNRAILETYGEIALGPYAESQIGRAVSIPIEKTVEALKDLLREAKVSTTSVGVSIPASASLLRIISMPPLPPDKLRESIPLEVRKFIPVPVSEVLLDWQEIPKAHVEKEASKEKEAETIDVLVAAIHNEVLNRYRQIIEGAGLSVSFFEIEIFSTSRAVLDRNKFPTMILDIGAATTKVYIVEQGIIRGSHIINAGSQNITLTLSSALGVPVEEAEEMKRESGLKPQAGNPTVSNNAGENLSLILDSLLSEVARVKSNFETKRQVKIAKVVLTGGGTIISGLLERAVKVFDTEVVVADPFSRVESPAILDPVLKEAGPEFAVAIGLALRKLDELS